MQALVLENDVIKLNQSLAMMACLLAAGVSSAQTVLPVPRNVVQLSASAVLEVPQDLLTITLNTSVEGAQAQHVQTQLKQALDAALSEVRPLEKAGQMDVRTGSFSLSPRYGRDGKPTGWQGRAELLLEGRDFARITAAAGQVQTLTVGQVSFGLSREQRTLVEREAQRQAIESFKARATEIALSFGLTRYTLREVSVMAQDQGYESSPRRMALSAKAASMDSPLPVEAGKAAVTVNVSGSVQLD